MSRSSSVTPRASCCSAPRRSPSSGSLDLDTDHLLYAALQDGVVRHVLDQIDADPEAISAQLEEEVDKGGRTDVSCRCRRTPRLRCSPPMRSRVSSAAPMSGQNTCCWR